MWEEFAVSVFWVQKCRKLLRNLGTYTPNYMVSCVTVKLMPVGISSPHLTLLTHYYCCAVNSDDGNMSLVWFGLFVHPLSPTCTIGHVNYSLQFMYYNTTFLRSDMPVVYIRTTVDQWSKHSSQKQNYIYIYNNLSTTCFGHFLTGHHQVGVQCKRNYTTIIT
jgi:hypothetical protein